MTVPDSRSRTLIVPLQCGGPRSTACGPPGRWPPGSSSEHRLHHLLGDRRRHRAALALRALDVPRDGPPRVLDRREADERDLVAGRAAADLGGARLARHVDALERGGGARALLD